jgi:DNA polymerase III gamma/tau subunit
MNTKIIGHKKQRDFLEIVMAGNAKQQSFIFSGPTGVGKYTIARSFAKLVNDSEKSVKEWNICTEVDVDVDVVAPIYEEKKEKIVIHDISIDQIRNATKSLTLSPDKKVRILIIDQAHRMTLNAQNALLKTLEEPLEDRYIILVTDYSQKILQTLHSRCTHLQFGCLSNEDMTQVCQDIETIEDAGGRPGFLINMMKNEEFKDLLEYSKISLQNFFKNQTYEKMQLAEELSKKNDEQIEIFLQVWVYRIRNASFKVSKFNLLSMAGKVEDTLLILKSSNANKKLVLENLFINMV